ncbi:MAG: hypothetical protein QNJ53_26010 [Pleurocapsa sp. MO_192.B19]|nr:hypothetical protein [Pleurocapsa sp. MO_192.B19]
MSRKTDGVLQIRYVKNSTIGKIIEELKKSDFNVSQKVRDYIMFINGYEVLKKTNKDMSQEQLQEICLKNLQFFVTQYEISKINLEQEKQNLNSNSLTQHSPSNITHDPHPESDWGGDHKSQTLPPKPSQKTQTKDLSMIDSLIA